RREERPDVHIEAEVRECRRNDLLAPVMPVLADLGDQNARAAPVVALEAFDESLHFAESAGHGTRLRSIDARYRADFGAMTSENHLQRIRDLADRCLRPRSLDSEVEQIGIAVRPLGQRDERGGYDCRIALALEARELRELLLAYLGVVDPE